MHPIHHKEFRERRLVAEMEPGSLFADLIESVPGLSGVSDRERVAKAVKNPMWLIVGIRSCRFPLRGGQRLYVNMNSQNGPDLIILKWNATLETADGIKTSLDAAERVYHSNRRRGYGSKLPKVTGREPGKSKGDPWVQIKVGEPGFQYISLSELFANNFDKLDVPVDVLTDRVALARFLLDKGWITAPHLRLIQIAAKLKPVPRAKPNGKSGTKKPAPRVQCVNPVVCKVSYHREGTMSARNCGKTTPVDSGQQATSSVEPLEIPVMVVQSMSEPAPATSIGAAWSTHIINRVLGRRKS